VLFRSAEDLRRERLSSPRRPRSLPWPAAALRQVGRRAPKVGPGRALPARRSL